MTVEQHQHASHIEILTIRQGILFGVAAATLMAVVSMAGFALSGKGLWTPINAIGSFLLSSNQFPAGFSGALTLIGLVIQLTMGGLLGALYASAQERIDKPSLLAVATYYGLVIWIVATFAILSWLRPPIHDVMRTLPLLVAHLVYGSLLGLLAASQSGEPCC
jgi:hypothetical protein